jgi:hypothetical protein
MKLYSDGRLGGRCNEIWKHEFSIGLQNDQTTMRITHKIPGVALLVDCNS